MNETTPTAVAGQVERRVSLRCGDCANIGEHGWGLPYDKKRCLKIKERQADFDEMLKRRPIEPIDAFRFRPTDGVLPYQCAGKCRHFVQANV